MGRRLSSLRPALEVWDYWGKQHLFRVTHVYLSLSLSFYLHVLLSSFLSSPPSSHHHTTHVPHVKPYKQTQEVLDLQCLFSRPPEMLEEHIPRCMSFYANILCTSLATDKNPINWEWTKEVCFVGLISSVIDWLDRQILFLWTDLGTSNKTKA